MSLQGELVDNIGEDALLADNGIHVELEDGSVLAISITIYGDTLNPLFEDEAKKQGLLALGRLVMKRISS